MDGAFHSRAVGRERDLPTVTGDVSGSGGDGGAAAGADDGSGDDVCTGVLSGGRILDSQTVSRPFADFDVHADHSHVCHNCGLAVAGVSAGDE